MDIADLIHAHSWAGLWLHGRKRSNCKETERANLGAKPIEVTFLGTVEALIPVDRAHLCVCTHVRVCL